MSAKRYFQLSFLWPVVLAALILAVPRVLLPNWMDQLCREALYSGGIPYLLFAAATIFWSRNKEGATVRRATYLSPLLSLLALAQSLVMAGLRAGIYGQFPAELLVWAFVYGLLLLMPVLILGYAYVGLINLLFVILRSLGAFQDDLQLDAWAIQNAYQSPSHEADRLDAKQASRGPLASVPAQRAGDCAMPGSRYAFVWDPLRAAALALLAPLIVLSAFALCRHYRVLHHHHQQPAAIHQVEDGPIYRAGSATRPEHR